MTNNDNPPEYIPLEDDCTELDFNASNEPEELELAETEVTDSDVDEFPAIFRNAVFAVEAEYRSGCRKKETVCGVCTASAAKHVAKTFGNDYYPMLFGAGYEAALNAWGRYDPSKDTGGGVEAYIFKHAEGHMRNAANEMANGFNKRKHFKGQELPKTVSYAPDACDGGLIATAASPACHTDDIADTDFSVGDAAIYGAAERAAKSTAVDDGLPVAFGPEPPQGKRGARWTERPIPPAEAAPLRTDREAKEATRAFAEPFVRQVMKLPKRDRDMIVMTFGLEGKEECTQEEIAEHIGVSQSYISKLQNKALDEIRRTAFKENPRTVAIMSEEDKPIFRNGAKIRPTPIRRVLNDGKWRAQAWDLWSTSP